MPLENPSTAEQTLSVSQLNRQVKRLLESHFGFVWVEGEISNLARPGSGHWYFTLKDDNGQVRCAMFRNSNQRVRISPENGQLVKIRARVSLYEGRGEFQLIAEHMEAAGSGTMQLAFEQLKQKLNAEGLFSAERKRELPEHPQHIAIITSPTGAAIRDILSVFRRRFPAIEISILPVPVQGQDSAPALTAALRAANRWQQSGQANFDALVLTRGGGSIEDLWSFNDETLARAIADSELPVVSAVGHEIDFTIADFAADARAPTPSAAAELLSPDGQDLLQKFRQIELSMQRAQRNFLQMANQQLSGLARSLRHPGERLQEQSQRLDSLDIRLGNAIRNQLRGRDYQLRTSHSALSNVHPGQKLQQSELALNTLKNRARLAIQKNLQQAKQRMETAQSLINSLGPQATLERGYAIVTDIDGRILTDANQVQTGDSIQTRLAQGALRSTVELDD
jgi:exodeoxyribonuclease VII large subunit